MNRARLAWLFATEFLAATLIFVLFGGSPVFWPAESYAAATGFLKAHLHLLFVVGFLAAFSAAAGRPRRRFVTDNFPGNYKFLFLAAILLIGLAAFLHQSVDDSLNPAASVWSAAIALGLGLTALVGSVPAKISPDMTVLTLAFLTLWLAAASSFHWSPPVEFKYHGQLRWSGPWDNPNLFGLLMGTGVVASLGLSTLCLCAWVDSPPSAWWGAGRFALFMGCLAALGLLTRGLALSYSRGAWLGTACGLAWLATHGFTRCRQPTPQGGRAGLAILMSCSILILIFWGVCDAGLPMANRLFSSLNQNDFSRANRLAALCGTLQMIAEKPWNGFGWNQAEATYAAYYLSPKVFNGQAIEMNDYLILGATLGLSALLALAGYLWLSLKANPDPASLEFQPWTSQRAKTICHAGAIVLLIGFWFDGGLFKLPTAATFWILLELGAVGRSEKRESGNSGRRNVRLAAAFVGGILSAHPA